jgi:anti-anti-sigma factor
MIDDQAESLAGLHDVPVAVEIELALAGIVVARVHGELDFLTTPAVLRTLREQADHATHLVVDVGEVEFMGSSALAMLVALHDADPAVLHLAGVLNRKVRRPLEITGLLGLFNTFDTAEDAIAALSTS